MGHAAPPGRLGPYRLVRELARGGMGVVYEAVHEVSGARHALKTLLPAGLGGPDDEELHRFRREVEVLGRLDHPHVVRVHAADLRGPVPWLAQDLLPGGSLQRRLEQEGPLAVEEATAIARDLALALAHAHERGALHRDVKPHNVLFDDLGAARLVDFGLARRLEGASRLTATGVLLGTPAFMAPEQAEAAGRVDERTDVYGLGATLWAMLVGRPPYEAGSVWATVEQVLQGRLAPPSRQRAGVPAWVDQVVLRAMARDPAGRYASARELARALEGSPARAGGPLRRAVAVALLVGGASLALGLVATRRPGAPADVPAPTSEPAEAAASSTRASTTPTDALPGDPLAAPPEELVPIADGEWRHATEGSTFVWVPPATVRRDDREVSVKGFFMGKHEVTFGQFRAFVDESGREVLWLSDCSDTEAAHSLSWVDAVAYCEHHGVRLPDEDEWLLAAFGTDDRPTPWGDAPPTPERARLCYGCNVADVHPPSHHPGPPGTAPAGASPFGCLDMIGNAAEWVADELPRDQRAIRGGGAGAHAEMNCRAERRVAGREATASDRGFRVALSPRRRRR